MIRLFEFKRLEANGYRIFKIVQNLNDVFAFNNFFSLNAFLSFYEFWQHGSTYPAYNSRSLQTFYFKEL